MLRQPLQCLSLALNPKAVPMLNDETYRSQTASRPPVPLGRNEYVLDALNRFERPLVEYACRLFCGDLHAARDSVQYTFMQLCKQEPEKIGDKLCPWLYSVCRNHVLDQLRSKRHHTVTGFDYSKRIDQTAVDPARQTEKHEILRKLKSLCGDLNQRERGVVDLWSHGFSTNEIAEMLDRSPGAVRVCIHRAIKRFRKNPVVMSWLERATGQIVEPDGSLNSSSKYNGNKMPLISGEEQ